MLKIKPVKNLSQFRVPTSAKMNTLKERLRRVVIDWIVQYVRHRVKDESLQMGRAPIKGYSTNPLTIPYVSKFKPYRRPKGGKPMGVEGQFFQGGYAEYRHQLGLSSAFTFYNKGDAWRDWKALSYGGDSTPGEIGFTKETNAFAASRAEEDRPLLFSIDEHELDMVNIKVIEQIDRDFFN